MKIVQIAWALFNVGAASGCQRILQRLTLAGFSLRIQVAGERCNVTGEYFESGSTPE